MVKSIVIGKEIPLETVVKDSVLLLLDINPFFHYDELNKKTEIVDGYMYEVVDTMSFNKISVKIKGQRPLLKKDELLTRRESGEKIPVELVGGKVKVYYSSYYNMYVDSFTAESIHFVENIDIF